MQVITFSNEKGGVGKTTLAIHSAAGMAVRGKRVLIIDADAQGNATVNMGLEEEPGFYDLLVRGKSWQDVLRVIPPEAYEPPNQKSKGLLAVLPSNTETQFIAQKIDDAFLMLRRLMELQDQIDLVVFDTSPTPSLLHSTLYLASNGIVYPTLCEALSLRGLVKTIAARHKFARIRQQHIGKPLEVIGIVPNMYRGKTVEHSENLRELQNDPEVGHYVWEPLALSIAWSEASTLRRPVWNIDPNSAASRQAWRMVQRIERSLQHAQ